MQKVFKRGECVEDLAYLYRKKTSRTLVFVRLIYWASAARRSNFNRALNLSALQGLATLLRRINSNPYYNLAALHFKIPPIMAYPVTI